MKILVLIVTYNGIKWIDKCLTALRHQGIPLSILVVDNCSTDGTLLHIRKFHPECKIIESDRNLGFGRANNVGLSYAIENNFDYVFLLNQDVYLDSSCLKTLTHLHQKNQNYGVISPFQLNGVGNDYDKNFKIVLNNANLPIYLKATSSFQQELYPVNFVMAAMWLVSSECLKKVGFFDTIFSHYGEDNDYANRAKFHGFEIAITPLTSGRHDREFRNNSSVKDLNIRYAGILSEIANINKSPLRILGEVTLTFLKLVTKAIISLNLELIKKNFALMYSLIKQIPAISKVRADNAKGLSGLSAAKS